MAVKQTQIPEGEDRRCSFGGIRAENKTELV